MDSRLTEVMVCPACKGALKMDNENQVLVCHKCELGYPIKNGIPAVLAGEALRLVKNEEKAETKAE